MWAINSPLRQLRKTPRVFGVAGCRILRQQTSSTVCPLRRVPRLLPEACSAIEKALCPAHPAGFETHGAGQATARVPRSTAGSWIRLHPGSAPQNGSTAKPAPESRATDPPDTTSRTRTAERRRTSIRGWLRRQSGASCSTSDDRQMTGVIDAVAGCSSGRSYTSPSDTPRGVFPNSLMNTGRNTWKGSS